MKPRHGSFGATATQDTFEEKLNAIMQEKQQLSDVTVRAGTWKKLFVAGNDEQSTPAWDYDTSELKIHIHNSSHSVSKGPERYEALNHHSFTWGPNNIPTRWVAWDCSWDCRGEDWIADLNDAQLRDLFSLGSWGGFFPGKTHDFCQKNCSKEEEHLDGVPTKSPWNRRKSWWNLWNMHSSNFGVSKYEAPTRKQCWYMFSYSTRQGSMGVFSISGFHLNDSFPYLDPQALKSWKVPNR